ncbi:uncharacterized protein [Hyperolius riggenbachi]|uniref:uncharacterized protein n=1 Tax=Hyperolius riggenbachi TaxID=752182 RepID=UPI0035A2BDD4
MLDLMWLECLSSSCKTKALMDWPAHSPDLNPIKHIWDITSHSVHQRHAAPQTVQELADALVQFHFLCYSYESQFSEEALQREDRFGMLRTTDDTMCCFAEGLGGICSGLILLLCCPFVILGAVIKCIFPPICCGLRRQKQVIGIFSYSSPEDFRWIEHGLRSHVFKHLVEDVKLVYISDSRKVAFQEAVHECDFAILYHTKNRGRINITNVTDALYDEELKYMYSCKGMMKVIVVVDDLDQVDYQMQTLILTNQPDIGTYARDLLLFSREDKTQQWRVDNNLQRIGDLVDGDSWTLTSFRNYLASLIQWALRWCSVQCSCFAYQSLRRELDGPLLV